VVADLCDSLSRMHVRDGAPIARRLTLAVPSKKRNFVPRAARAADAVPARTIATIDGVARNPLTSGAPVSAAAGWVAVATGCLGGDRRLWGGCARDRALEGAGRRFEGGDVTAWIAVAVDNERVAVEVECLRRERDRARTAR
jgi:hypothetical protein